MSQVGEDIVLLAVLCSFIVVDGLRLVALHMRYSGCTDVSFSKDSQRVGKLDGALSEL